MGEDYIVQIYYASLPLYNSSGNKMAKKISYNRNDSSQLISCQGYIKATC